MKKLLSYEFEFVENLRPVVNKDGTIKEFYPQKGYIEKHPDAVLNKYGDGAFCRFSIDPKWYGVSGVYAYYIDDNLIYIGQCLDFAKRFNMGYGNITSHCCVQKGGQSTNCKMNKVVLEAFKNPKTVAVYFCRTPSYDAVEAELIQYYNPKYNTMLTNKLAENHDRPKQKVNALTKSVGQSRGSTAEIRAYILDLLRRRKEAGLEHVMLVSGDIHREMGLTARMPSVCASMYAVMREQDIVLKTTPSGKSSTITIQYFLD